MAYEYDDIVTFRSGEMLISRLRSTVFRAAQGTSRLLSVPVAQSSHGKVRKSPEREDDLP